ncbi:hypothetical protein [Siccibacter turicensis]|uniref:hypothetical protein n=1 Tax=Siccibacter turicensis TaxID=357233 RepID=UPI0012DF271F|nr:hypothetical protein [Siccibacter turicensis]
MLKNLDACTGVDRVCEANESADPAKIEPDSLTAEVLSSVFDIADITIVNQAVGKSFSD